MNRFDELKRMIQEPNIPERLSPESIKQALDAQQTKKKEKTIRRKTRLRWIAGIAACGVAVSTGGYVVYRAGMGSQENDTNILNFLTADAGNYCTSSDSYDTVAAFMAHYVEENGYREYEYGEMEIAEEAVEEQAVDGAVNDVVSSADFDYTAEESSIALGEGSMETTDTAEGGLEYSETYNQEQGVLESDIVLTDGEYLYSKRTGTE